MSQGLGNSRDLSSNREAVVLRQIEVANREMTKVADIETIEVKDIGSGGGLGDVVEKW